MCCVFYTYILLIYYWGVLENLIGRPNIMGLRKYSLKKNGIFFTLIPLLPRQVYIDQIRLKKEVESLE
jgi:hypothetical protein